MLAVAFGLAVTGPTLGQDADSNSQTQGPTEATPEVSQQTKQNLEVVLPASVTSFVERIAATLESIEAKEDPPEKTEREKDEIITMYINCVMLFFRYGARGFNRPGKSISRFDSKC